MRSGQKSNIRRVGIKSYAAEKEIDQLGGIISMSYWAACQNASPASIGSLVSAKVSTQT